VYEHASGHATPASTSWPDSEATVVEPAAGDAAAALEAHLAELETCMSGLTGLFSAEPPETVATVRFARVLAHGASLSCSIYLGISCAS
jgi:hypothetical protein